MNVNLDEVRAALGPIDPAALRNAIERHEREPDVAPQQYLRRLMIGLGETISSKRKIYLDTRFWILLRNAALDRPAKPEHSALLHELRRAVASGNVICPISGVVFVELLKQSDETSRRATASIIDELSSGISLVFSETRAGTELAHFMHKTRGRTDVHPLKHLVWTKMCFTLGDSFPTRTSLESSVERVLQKSFIDFQWSMPLEKIVLVLSAHDRPIPQNDFDQTAQRLNDGIRAHAHEFRTFHDVMQSEIAGVLDPYKGQMADILERMQELETGRPAQSSDKERAVLEAGAYTMFVNLFRLRQKVVAASLPTIYVQAKCHAAVRWNRGRNLTGNDLLDFDHAAGGLGYCDAFFTDKPLHTLLSQKHMALPDEFGCFVTASEDEALDFVRKL